MTITIKHGDLLREDVDAIVNTVNCVGVMGKGIALQFKQKWPRNFRAYEKACKRGEVQPGKMFVFDAGGLARPSFIINFPTKKHWRGKSRIEYITEGLEDLVEQVRNLRIKSIAVPPLGCGNGGLDWNEVRQSIIDAFEQLPDVTVALFSPDGAPPPQEMENRTAKPSMTPARAAIVKILSVYREMQYALGRIEVQKLIYFLEEAGQPLKLDFEKNQYGPFSNKLRHVLKAMDGHYIRGVGDHASRAEIVAIPEAVEVAEEFLKDDGDDEVRARVERVTKLIEGFETPYGMELLATVHWVANHDPYARTLDDAVAAVHSWNERKRVVLPREHIALAWRKLNDTGWIPQAQPH